VELAVVEGVLKLLEEGACFPELSMERIARTAGVGKATLYRRWRDKEELFVDVVRATEPPDPELPGTSVRDDLVVLLESVRRRGVARRSSAMLLNVHAQMKAGPRLWREYHERMIQPRRRLVAEVLRRGQRTGEIRADLDVQFAHDLIVGPMLLRTVLTYEPDLPEGLSEEIVDTVLEALRPGPPR
jgi:AcrR family transcriptional regulator